MLAVHNWTWSRMMAILCPKRAHGMGYDPYDMKRRKGQGTRAEAYIGNVGGLTLLHRISMKNINFIVFINKICLKIAEIYDALMTFFLFSSISPEQHFRDENSQSFERSTRNASYFAGEIHSLTIIFTSFINDYLHIYKTFSI